MWLDPTVRRDASRQIEPSIPKRMNIGRSLSALRLQGASIRCTLDGVDTIHKFQLSPVNLQTPYLSIIYMALRYTRLHYTTPNMSIKA